MPTAYRRPLLLALLTLWTGAVAYLTLTPTGYTPPLTLRGFLCMGCGELDGSDMIRNWILFLPGGLLGALLYPPARVLGLAVGFTALIETLQIGIPGRDTGLQDLLMNSLGAATGVAVAYRGLGAWSRRVLAATAGAAWLAPLLLLVPMTTSFDLYGQWTPRFGNTAKYEGRIVEATVGDIPVVSWRIEDKAGLDVAVLERRPVLLLLQVGPRPYSFAPVFQIVDGEQQGVLELGALGPDLILRGRDPARILRLDQPDARWAGAMAGVPVGDTVPVVVDRSRGSVCMSVGDRERCGLAPSLGDGWAHVLNLEGPPAWFRALMALGWAMGLGGIMGLTASGRTTALGLATAAALLGYLGAWVSPDVRPDLLHGVVLVGGAFLGSALRSPLGTVWSALRRA